MKDFKKHLAKKHIHFDLRKQAYIENKKGNKPVFNTHQASLIIDEVNAYYGCNMSVQRLQSSSLKECILLAQIANLNPIKSNN